MDEVGAQMEKAFESAREQQGASLFGVPAAGIYALCVERRDGGLGMMAYEGGRFMLGFTLAQDPGTDFKPESCLSACSGPIWDAICASPKIQANERATRAWQSWQEIFEGMALLRQWRCEGAAEPLKSSRKPFFS